MKKRINIGIEVKLPKKTCNDKNCPFHSNLKIRGRTFTGVVMSDKMHKSLVVEWERRQLIRKYERYEKRKTRIKVHNPECINAKEGDKVRIVECRPLSKTKNFTVIEIIGKERQFKEKSEAKEEAKVKEKVKEEPKEEKGEEESAGN